MLACKTSTEHAQFDSYHTVLHPSCFVLLLDPTQVFAHCVLCICGSLCLECFLISMCQADFCHSVSSVGIASPGKPSLITTAQGLSYCLV